MNMKRLIPFMKHALLVVVVLSTLFISSCDKDDDGPTVYNGSVLSLINDNQYKQATTGNPDNALDSLAKYLAKYPDLVTLLDGSGEFTVFAPSNTAFGSLIATVGVPLESISPQVIESVLKYHIVEGKVLKSALTPTGSAGAGTNTLFSSTNPCTGAQTVQVIKVNDNGTLLTGASNKAIEFQKEDNRATNGVVHIVKSVMVPPSIGDMLLPMLGKLSAVVLLGKDFSYLARVITKADCGVSGVTPLAAMLTDVGPFTAFLPPNAVFVGTANAWPGGAKTVDQLIETFTAAQWRNILLNHIVSGTYNLASLTNATELTTSLSGGKLTVTDVAVSTNTPKGKILGTSGASTSLGGTQQAPIMVSDIATSNGVGHVVGKILFPN
jgi:transforming growth factor-beta-induced protein